MVQKENAIVDQIGRDYKGNHRTNKFKKYNNDGNKKEKWKINAHRQGGDNQGNSTYVDNEIKMFNCFKCGNRHTINQCPAYGKKCNLCGKQNHFAIKVKMINNANGLVNEVQVNVDKEVSYLTLNTILGRKNVKIGQM